MREVFAERKNAAERRGPGHGSQLSAKASKAPFLKTRGSQGHPRQSQEDSYTAVLESSQARYERAGLQDGWFQQRKKAGLAVALLDVAGLVEKCSERLLEVVGWISN